jgi:hypothetical protein
LQAKLDVERAGASDLIRLTATEAETRTSERSSVPGERARCARADEGDAGSRTEAGLAGSSMLARG